MSTNSTPTAPDAILSILRAATLDGSGITLNGQLDRKDYDAVNKFLTASGAAWDRKAKRHLFTTPAAAQKISDLLSTGTVRDDKKHFQAFYTPPAIIDWMIQLAEIEDHHDVLEPSCGDGRIVRAVKAICPSACITAVELDPSKTVAEADLMVHADFMDLTMVDLGCFRTILMNPPFTLGQDIAHILHARHFLRPGGRLVGICANGPKQQDKLGSIAKFYDPLPANTFKESGTGVNAALVLLEYAS